MILSPEIPEGFEDFWIETVQEAFAALLDFHLLRAQEHPTQNHSLEVFSFRGIQGETLQGWIATPSNYQPENPCPAFIWLHPYGLKSRMPNEYGTRENFVSLSFNFHGYPPFYEEEYTKERGYFTKDLHSKEAWYFRRMFQNACIAIRILSSLPQVDSERIASMGFSQGGGMSIWLASWLPLVKAVCADMPFFGGVVHQLSCKVYRYPTKEFIDFFENDEAKRQKTFQILQYYDTINHASFCKRPVQVSYGIKDPAVKLYNAKSIYEALPGKKRFLTYNTGHDWYPDMVQNNNEWLLEHL